MNLILLSGGGGQRLWPLSNSIRSKQFIQVYKTHSGEYESMVQRVYRQITAVDPGARVTIATNQRQQALIREQLGDKVTICLEPERRDTFPAIALATAFLHDCQQVNEDEPVIVCPVDPYVDESYFHALYQLCELVKADGANLSLLGIQPNSPSEKYGYILPADDAPVSPVKAFYEKPDIQTAEGYLKQNALWNGGVFAFRLRYLLDYLKRTLGFADYHTLHARYGTLKKTSFDYAVVEHEQSIQVLRYNGRWEDLGSWAAFADAIAESTIGAATLDDSCEDVTVINETDVPVLVMGCRHTVVAASRDGILVTDKAHSGGIKPYVEALANASPPPPAADIIPDSSNVQKLTLPPGHTMALPVHSGSITILSGAGMLNTDGDKTPVASGDVINLAVTGSRSLTADRELQLIQVICGARAIG